MGLQAQKRIWNWVCAILPLDVFDRIRTQKSPEYVVERPDDSKENLKRADNLFRRRYKSSDTCFS
jgi:hypothetical protein